MADLSESVLAFCALLRAEYDIDAGYDRALQALRAVETVGIGDRNRVRYAMRLSLCASPDEAERFDRAFDLFFGSGARRTHARKVPHDSESAAHVSSGAFQLQSHEHAKDASSVLVARYSPLASEARSGPALPESGLAEMLLHAARLLNALRLGRSRRWKSRLHGNRFDMRGTLRSSLQTGGYPFHIRTLGHPPRNPRIIVLIDASRSMSEHSLPLLQFAYALCRRSKRVRVFVFSTALREITRELRSLRGKARLQSLGEAWGGGTRIAASLSQFARECGMRIDADTLAIVASDGLDTDDPAPLQRAMRQIYRRSAGVIWLNPHARTRGFDPSARAMKAALPYISALLDAREIREIPSAARRLRR